MVTVTPIYLSFAALIYVWLSIRVIKMRISKQVAVGDAGDRGLLQRTRAHGNFAEYAPVAFLLLLCAELQGTPVWVLHLVGAAILIGRSLHAWGMSQNPEPLKFRQAGMTLTFLSIFVLALGNLGHAVF